MDSHQSTEILGIIFDKDGTLFDLECAWGKFMGDYIVSTAPNDPQLQRTRAHAVQYDWSIRAFLPDAPARFATKRTINCNAIS